MRIIEKIDVGKPGRHTSNFTKEIDVGYSVGGLIKRPGPIVNIATFFLKIPGVRPVLEFSIIC